MKPIFSTQAPRAIGPYAQAIVTGQRVYCSGQTPLDAATMKIESPNIEDQTRTALLNLEAVLHEAGITLADVVKTNVYLTDMKNFARMNAVYETCFGSHRPARTTVAVLGLPHDALVEIECIAEINIHPNS